MQWFEYLIIAIAVLFVSGVIFLYFFLKKRGKSLTGNCCDKCSGNCSCCQHQCGSHDLLDEYHKSLKKS